MISSLGHNLPRGADRIYHNRKGIEFIHNIVMLGKQTIGGAGVSLSDHLGLACSGEYRPPAESLLLPLPLRPLLLPPQSIRQANLLRTIVRLP